MKLYSWLLVVVMVVAGAQESAVTDLSSLKLKATSSKCVRIFWQSATGATDRSLRYQYNCSGVTGTTLANSTEVNICNYKPYSSVTCNIKAADFTGASAREKLIGPIQTYCEAPEPPYNLSIVRADNYDYSGGFKSWKYNVSWEPPTEVNCKSLSSYPAIYRVGSLQKVYINVNYAIFSLNAGENVTFSVWAVNNWNRKSKPLTAQLYAPAAAPSRPNFPVIEAVSPTCVHLEWSWPTFSNGKLVRYEYLCSERKEWVPTLDADNRSVVTCGYKPYTQVDCKVRAINGAKEPGEESVLLTTSTLCDAPEPPRNLKLHCNKKEQKSIKESEAWICVATWQKPKEHNCQSLHSLEAYLWALNNNSQAFTISEEVSFVIEDGGHIIFSIQSKNDANLTSDWVTVEMTAVQVGGDQTKTCESCEPVCSDNAYRLREGNLRCVCKKGYFGTGYTCADVRVGIGALVAVTVLIVALPLTIMTVRSRLSHTSKASVSSRESEIELNMDDLSSRSKP